MNTNAMDPTSTSGTPGSASPPVVTIWEEYGSGAEEIGRAVAERLGLPYHRQAFSSEELEGAEAPPADDDAATAIVSRISLSQVFAAMGGTYAGGDGGQEYMAAQQEKRALVDDNNATVWRSANDGGVIVGRNATKILAERPHTLHVLLTADAESRIARAAELAGISRQQATARQRHEDKVRADMSTALYGWDPRDPEHYDLMINTGRIPHQAAVEAIVHAVQRTAA